MIDVKPADLILVRGMSPCDRVIEGVSHSPYSHCAGLVKTNEVFETQVLRGAEYNGLDFYRGASDIYICDTMTDEQRQRAIEYALSKAGRPRAELEKAFELQTKTETEQDKQIHTLWKQVEKLKLWRAWLTGIGSAVGFGLAVLQLIALFRKV